jgi:hypothetical protein
VPTSFPLLLVILIFPYFTTESVIEELLTAATYTYGPLLGLFAFGIFLTRRVGDPWIPVVAVLAPIATWLIADNSQELLWGYRFGYEKLLLNGLLTFLGLLSFSKPSPKGQEGGTG